MSAPRVYADNARTYRDAGWPAVLPLPAGTKEPPPKGYTGYAGRWPSPADHQTWEDFDPDGNLALRLPPDVIGTDVDNYGGKQGAATLAELEAKLGPLPATVVSTSRDDGVSGIRLYRVPLKPGWRNVGLHVETISFGWRYMVAPPSIHPDTGLPYRWIDQRTGAVLDYPPRPEDLPWLPAAWVDYLARTDGPADKVDVSDSDVVEWLRALPAGSACHATSKALEGFHADFDAGGSRHDATLRPTAALVRAGERGHRGVRDALTEARTKFLNALAADRPRHSVSEWRRIIVGAVAIVVAAPTAQEDHGCRCAPDIPPFDPPDAGAPEWDRPEPLGRHVEIAPFPTHTLPEPFAGYVAALSISMQTPPDLAGMLTLAVLAVCAGGRVRVRVTSDWIEPTNLYTVVVLGSGERKSPVFAKLLEPLEAAERKLIEDAKTGILGARTQSDIATKAAAYLRDRASKASEPGERQKLIGEAEEAAEKAERIKVPPHPRLLAENTTPEILTTRLAEQGGRMAVMSDEGGIFDIMAGLYTSGRINLDVYLKGHSGVPIRVDRVGREAERIECPALTVGLTVQPVVLRKIVAHDEFIGRGLLARFLYAVPRSVVGTREINPPTVPERLARRYHGTVTTLAEGLTPVTLELTDDARERLDKFRRQLEARMGPSGDLGHIAAWALKLPGQAVRIAGLLHVADRADRSVEEPIDGQTMQSALTIAEYAVSHAIVAFDLMSADPVMYGARRVLRWIQDRETPDAQFTRRDAHQGLRAVFETVDAIEPALRLLEQRGYIRRCPSKHVGRGRPPSPTFDVNPGEPEERQ